ncbi:thioredoxin-disulfide reductase [bacterium]|nr:thioredoxin-disulfide reductase [bacterium]
MADYDVLIIGGGPGGLTAGIYTGRALVKTGLVEKMMCGGQMGTTEWIDNYPGFENGVAGFELSQQMEKQARRFGVDINTGTVTAVDLTSNPKKITAGDTTYEANAVIISTGSNPRMLGIPGEAAFRGRGVSYCGTCDAPFFKDKDVLVVGGGSTSMQESLHIAKFAKSVKLISRRPRLEELKGEKILLKRVLDHEKIELLLHKKLVDISGEQKVTGGVIEDIGSGERESWTFDGVFIFIGEEPNSALFRGQLELNENGAIITNERMETSVPGVIAVGDVRDTVMRQISVAIGDGAIGAHSAIDFVESLESSGD